MAKRHNYALFLRGRRKASVFIDEVSNMLQVQQFTVTALHRFKALGGCSLFVLFEF
jgi:hypothetical protein